MYNPEVKHWSWFRAAYPGVTGILKVVKETPQQIEMNNGRRFWKKSLKEVGSSDIPLSFIEAATLAHKNQCARKIVIGRIKKTDWSKVSDEKLAAIGDMLKEED